MYKLKVVLMSFLLSISCFYCLDGQEKAAVFIVTPGRSGSSCAAGVMKILGLPMGHNLVSGNELNAKGYYEDKPTFDLNASILQQCGSHIIAPCFIDWKKEPRREHFKEVVRDHLDRHFGHLPVFGIKNPQIALVFPLYLEAAKELGYTPKVVIVLRHPGETARSWAKILKSESKASFPVMYQYLMPIVQYAPDYETMVIYFDDLLNKTEETVGRICEFISGLKPYNEVALQIERFIDRGLKHHNLGK